MIYLKIGLHLKLRGVCVCDMYVYAGAHVCVENSYVLSFYVGTGDQIHGFMFTWQALYLADRAGFQLVLYQCKVTIRSVFFP